MYSVPSPSVYTSLALMNAFTPPVPPIPAEHRTSTTSPIADVFSTPNRQLVDPTEKPLPQSPEIREREDLDEKSIVFVDKNKKASLPLAPSKPVGDAHITKRRSMSVGDADLHVVPPSTPSYPRTPEPKKKDDHGRWDDTTLHGILDDFKGELLQLDPVSGSSLDLRDPSTPQRQSSLRSRADSLRQGVKIPTPPLLLDKPETEEPEESGAFQPAIIPPRTSSLQTPLRSGSNKIGSPRTANSSPAVRSPSAGLAARDTSKLRVLHRSTASSSEPSLVPVADPNFCEFMDSSLVRS
jgi:PH/SEC7 domain-containing protein